MKSALIHLLAIACLGAGFAGCGSNPQRDVPGHLQPGPSIDVAQEWMGGGGASGGRQDLTIGALPFIDWTAPNIPIMQDGVVDIVYVWPQVSKDGEAMREGHHVYIKIAEQSFTAEQANAQRSLLNNADSSGIPEKGRVRSAELGPQVGPVQNLPPEMPFARGGQPTTRLSVVQVDPRSGSTQVVGSQTVPGAVPTSSDPAAINDSVRRMLDNFNAAQQAQMQPTGSTAPRTGATPSGTGTTPIPSGNP